MVQYNAVLVTKDESMKEQVLEVMRPHGVIVYTKDNVSYVKNHLGDVKIDLLFVDTEILKNDPDTPTDNIDAKCKIALSQSDILRFADSPGMQYIEKTADLDGKSIRYFLRTHCDKS